MPTPNPLERLEHAGAAVPTTLTASMSVSDVAFSIASNTGWPTGSIGPFYVVIDAGTGSEEKMLCSAQSTSVVTVAPSGRGVDGTIAKTHAIGASVYPVWTAQEADELNEHAASIAGVHGVVGDVVGTTDPQVLTGKTISGADNTLSNVAVGSLTGTLPVTQGGTGATTVAGVKTALGYMSRYVSTDFAASAGLTYGINHNLGTNAPVVAVYDVTTTEQIYGATVKVASTNQVTVMSEVALTLRVVVLG